MNDVAILGINAYHGDTAAAILLNGQLIAAVEEERFRRIKHCAGFPRNAIEECLRLAGISARDLDHIAVSRNPRANLFRKVRFALSKRPNPRLIIDRAKNQAEVSALTAIIANDFGLEGAFVRDRIHWVEHHPAHLASAFLVSPFETAAVCAVDGFGDFVSTSYAVGTDRKLELISRVFFPHSLGLLYLAITQFLGFGRYGDEYKVMGLASYGSPDYVTEIRQLLYLGPDGDFKLNLKYFRHWSDGIKMTWQDGEPIIGTVFTPLLEHLLGPRREPSDAINAQHEAIAASLQLVFEESVLHILNVVHKRTGSRNLCFAGGCAMNSVLNGKITSKSPFDAVYIQPGAGDDGTALGAAFYVWNCMLGNERSFVMEHAYWGTEFTGHEIKSALAVRQNDLLGTNTTVFIDDLDLCRWAASRIAEGKIVGWFQGRMEWGARALGNRSILADPRRVDMRDVINAKIKFRERFRPFAPSILEERLDQYFIGAAPDPFMVQVFPVRHEKRSIIPAVTHVDGSGRLQTVSRKTNELFWHLIHAFEAQTGVPLLLNTSFNENEPIVRAPDQALDCFLRTEMDVLVLGSIALEKATSPA